MDEKSLIFGVSYAVDSLIMGLIKHKTDLDLNKDYYVNISAPPILVSAYFGEWVISGLFVDITEDLVSSQSHSFFDFENEKKNARKSQN